MLVPFAVILSPYLSLGKPFKSQKLEQLDLNLTEKELEASHTVNGTVVIREKRAQCRTDIKCPGPQCRLSGNYCEVGRYFCLGYLEAVCKLMTFSTASACQRNIGFEGFPKCFPGRRRVIIKTDRGPEVVLQTKNCSC